MRILLFAFLFLHMGCSLGKYSPSDYMQWVEAEENGLRLTQSFSEIDFTLQYKPTDYIIAQEISGNKLTTNAIDSRRIGLEKQMHFNFIIHAKNSTQSPLHNGETREEYLDKMYYIFSSGEDDFAVRVGTKTVACSFCHLEQNYGLAPSVTLVLAFDCSDFNLTDEIKEHGISFLYNDQLFGFGQIRMRIDKNAVNEIPAVITTS